MTNHSLLRASGCALLLGLALHGAAMADTDDAFESELARLAGRAATQCGIFSLGKPADAGWTCAQAAERAGQAYWIASKGAGEDSIVGRAAIRTAAGVHILLDYDSNPFGGRATSLPRFVTTTCPWPIAYDRAARLLFDCVPPRPDRQGGVSAARQNSAL